MNRLKCDVSIMMFSQQQMARADDTKHRQTYLPDIRSFRPVGVTPPDRARQIAGATPGRVFLAPPVFLQLWKVPRSRGYCRRVSCVTGFLSVAPGGCKLNVLLDAPDVLLKQLAGQVDPGTLPLRHGRCLRQAWQEKFLREGVGFACSMVSSDLNQRHFAEAQPLRHSPHARCGAATSTWRLLVGNRGEAGSVICGSGWRRCRGGSSRVSSTIASSMKRRTFLVDLVARKRRGRFFAVDRRWPRWPAPSAEAGRCAKYEVPSQRSRRHVCSALEGRQRQAG